MLKKYRKFKKRVNGLFHVTEGPATHGYASFDARPEWVDAISPLEYLHDVSWDENQCASGLSFMDSCTVIRRDSSSNVLGVRCNRGFTEGKHVFEFDWPAASRGKTACIGICNDGEELSTSKGILVGDTPLSWGWDMVRRKKYHSKAAVGAAYPPKGLSPTLPDRVLMFLDLDEGTLSFGCEGGTYWGVAHNDITRPGKPVYPMAGILYNGAIVKICYRGSFEEPKTPSPAPVETVGETSTANVEISETISPKLSSISVDDGTSNGTEAVDLLNTTPRLLEANETEVVDLLNTTPRLLEGVQSDPFTTPLYYDTRNNLEYEPNTRFTENNVPLTEL